MAHLGDNQESWPVDHMWQVVLGEALLKEWSQPKAAVKKQLSQ